MIPTPGSYQPYADVRRVNFGMSFGVVAVDAADAATASTAAAQFAASQIQQTHDRVELASAPFATLEHNIWVLDGSMSIYPEDLAGIQTGYLSEEMSSDEGVLTGQPTITFDFSTPQDSYGLTFRFDDQIPYIWPSKIKVAFFDSSGGQLFEDEYNITSTYVWVESLVQNYSRITVTFLSTAVPHRRARLIELIFGIVTRYDKKSIVSTSDQQSIDLLSESLSSAQLTVTIDNSEKLYNLVNPTGIYEYLQNGQYVNYWYTIGGQTVNAGIRYFYAAESDDSGLTASITFNDRMILLDDVVFNGGASGTWTLQEAITAILTAAEIKTAPTFEDDLESVVIRKCIPQETSAREAIRMCAQAAMCTCYVDPNDSLHFIRPVLKEIPDDQLTRDRLAEEPTVNIGDRYNAVTIKRNDSYVEDTEEESYTLSAAEEGDMVITKEVSNDLVNDMQEWAQWALPWIQRRTSFNIEYRGNPAIEMGDTVQVYDAFDVNGMALVESHDLEFNGGLSGSMTARR